MNKVWKVFETDSGTYLYNIYTLEYSKINPKSLKNYSECILDTSESLDKKIHLQNRNINSVQFQPATPGQNTARISFIPINSCNFNCKYCFAKNNYKNNKRIDDETIERIIEYTTQEYFSKCNVYRLDFVSGGEPFLNFEAIIRSVELLKKYTCQSGKTYQVYVVSNGSIYNKEIIEFINRNNIILGISLDGSQNIHDKNRIFQDGKGTHNLVMSNIERINETSEANEYQKIWFQAVITADNNVLDTIKFYEKMGVKRAQLKLYRKNETPNIYSIDEELIIKNSYDSFLEYIYRKICLDDISTLTMILNENDSFGKYLYRLILNKKYIRRCAAGVNKLSFDENGDIYPCDSFSSIQLYKLGNVEEGITNIDALNKFNTLNIFNSVKCSNCWIRYICGGDCYFNAKLANNNPLCPDEFICSMNKFFVKKSIELLVYLKSHKPLLYYKIKRITQMKEQINY